nr:hypothetical protein PBILCG01_0008200 [Plasmodium sp. DRC-Itaito]
MRGMAGNFVQSISQKAAGVAADAGQAAKNAEAAAIAAEHAKKYIFVQCNWLLRPCHIDYSLSYDNNLFNFTLS